jgi:hypothetical protein
VLVPQSPAGPPLSMAAVSLGIALDATLRPETGSSSSTRWSPTLTQSSPRKKAIPPTDASFTGRATLRRERPSILRTRPLPEALPFVVTHSASPPYVHEAATPGRNIVFATRGERRLMRVTTSCDKLPRRLLTTHREPPPSAAQAGPSPFTESEIRSLICARLNPWTTSRSPRSPSVYTIDRAGSTATGSDART